MLSESNPPSVADLLSLAIRRVEAMSSASIMGVRVGALEPTSSSSSTPIWELGSQLALNFS